MKTYDYVNRVVLTLPLSVYEGTWTTLSPLVAMHHHDLACGFFFEITTFPNSSSKQSVVAGSTCEAGYIAASEAANEGVWMKEFISKLGVTPSASGPMKIFCDNTGAIALAKESRFHKRTKHIKRRFNSIHDQVKEGDIEICKIIRI